MTKDLNPAVGGVIACLEKYLQDTMVSVDGRPAVPTYEECLGSYIGTYLDLFAEKIPVSIKYDSNGVYKGVNADVDADIPGFYCIGYEHPIDGTVSYYTGSTIKCIRDRLSMLSRLVITGKATGKESLTVPNRWVEKHGRNFDYAFIAYFPTDLKQSIMRPTETYVTNHFRRIYDDNVLNIATKAVRTLEWKEPTPELPGISI
jgi:hypothetical protein